MIDRRKLIAGSLAAGLASPARAAGPKLADDGMYHFDWYLESFLELADDLDAAAAAGKRLAVIWGQKGCIYCKRMAEEHLSDPRIADYVRANFDVLHLNLFGAREVTDFDGAKLSERELARRQGVRVTPTIIFMPESSVGLDKETSTRREVARMPGLLEPGPFLAMFRFVREKAYERSRFPEWLKENA